MMNTDKDGEQDQVQEEDGGVACAGAGETLRIVSFDAISPTAYAHDDTLRFAVGLDDNGVGTLTVEQAPNSDNAYWLMAETCGKRYGADALILPPPLLELVRAHSQRLCAQLHRSGIDFAEYRNILMQLIIELENAAGGVTYREKPGRWPLQRARDLAEQTLLAVIDSGRVPNDGCKSVKELQGCDAETDSAIKELRKALSGLARKPSFLTREASAGRYYRQYGKSEKYADINAFLLHLLKTHEDACREFNDSAAALEAWEKSVAVGTCPGAVAADVKE